MNSNLNVKYVITKKRASEMTNDSSPERTSLGKFVKSLSEASLKTSNILMKKDSVRSLLKLPMSKSASQILQQYIAKSSPEELISIISLVTPNMAKYMVDIYGNYMCQTMFQSISSEQRIMLIKAMQSELVNIAYHNRGTHALQNLISMLNQQEEEAVYLEEFQGKIADMSVDVNATHIIQRLLVHANNKFAISREIFGKAQQLALDKQGVCVVKKCCKDPQIMHEILENTVSLMQHPYANYSVQCILEYWKEEIAFEFISCIQGKVTQLCLQKYSSNVMEKAIKIENIKVSVVKEILDEYKIKEIAANQYGCYVLRSLSAEKKLNQRKDLLDAFKAATSGIYAPKLKILWKEIMQNLNL